MRDLYDHEISVMTVALADRDTEFIENFVSSEISKKAECANGMLILLKAYNREVAKKLLNIYRIPESDLPLYITNVGSLLCAAAESGDITEFESKLDVFECVLFSVVKDWTSPSTLRIANYVTDFLYNEWDPGCAGSITQLLLKICDAGDEHLTSKIIAHLILDIEDYAVALAILLYTDNTIHFDVLLTCIKQIINNKSIGTYYFNYLKDHLCKYALERYDSQQSTDILFYLMCK